MSDSVDDVEAWSVRNSVVIRLVRVTQDFGNGHAWVAWRAAKTHQVVSDPSTSLPVSASGSRLLDATWRKSTSSRPFLSSSDTVCSTDVRPPRKERRGVTTVEGNDDPTPSTSLTARLFSYLQGHDVLVICIVTGSHRSQILVCPDLKHPCST